MTQNTAHNVETPTKLVVRVLQDVIRREAFDSYADLVEALKCRCARLKVPYNSELVSNAIARLELGGKQPLIAGRLERRRDLEEVPQPAGPSREEARRIYDGVVEQLRRR